MTSRMLQRLFNTGCEAALIVISLVIAFWLRFELTIPAGVEPLLKLAIPLALVSKLPVFHFVGPHRSPRRHAGLSDLVRLAFGNFAASTLFMLVVAAGIGPAFPRSVILLDAVLCFLLASFDQFSLRLWAEAFARTRPEPKRILIYGAGVTGATLVREIRAAGISGCEAVGFLDDDPRKRNTVILGTPVLGSGRDAAKIVAGRRGRRSQVDEIVIAMPSATGRQIREVLANCRACRVPCRTIPGLHELLDGKVLASQIRDISLVDLLGRAPVKLDEAPIRSAVAGRSVMVTGAAGSIGSELCRQLARFQPALLIAFDRAESDLFKIDAELREKFPNLDLLTIPGDIRNPERLEEVIGRQGVESVFHAAAYKHVPMMEDHPLEAVQNNILGTWNLVDIVRRRGVPNFLMISTDKAVNPTSVMGVTKRVCELLVSTGPRLWGNSGTRCVSVRFGNVLGSNGSVIPIFQSQIAAGGPVRVTHPEMKRYFMTTSEAVSLILQASTMGKGGEIFVLDMGEPIRIVDLATNLIRLAGLEPWEDIDIQFTGPRPGEKLFEEINGSWEHSLPTFHEKIRIFRDPPLHFADLQDWLQELEELVAERRGLDVIAHIRRLVPEYQPSAKWHGPTVPMVAEASGTYAD